MTPIDFTRTVSFADLPPAVVLRAKRCCLDLVGVAASGTASGLSLIVRDHAVRQMGAGTGGATLAFDGRHASVAGAAFAGAFTTDDGAGSSGDDASAFREESVTGQMPA